MELMLKTSWLRPDLDLLSQLKLLTIPTFVLHRKQDIVPVWAVEKIRNAIPDAELVRLDDCNHYPYIEQPSQFFTELNTFLNKITP